MARPLFYHRSSTFRDLLRQVTDDLQHVYCTRQPVLTLTASGTGGMEAALASPLSPGARVLCLISGRWGERWRNIARALGHEVVSVTVPPGQAVAPEQLAEALRQHPDTQAVCATLCETATGVKNDVAAFGRIVASTPALLLVDSIAGLGCMECRTDDWHIDLNVTGSQKALMLPPGLAFVSVSDKAWRKIDSATGPRGFYFDLRKYRDALTTGDSPFTPALTLVRGLRVSLARMRRESNEQRWARYARLASAARAGVLALNLELLAAVPAESLTVINVPSALDGQALLTRLEREHGIKLAGGQDALKGKVLRLAHMGNIDDADILAALSALERVLLEMGHDLDPGAGVAAAQRVLAEPVPTLNMV
ncbi:MAG: alanine--glyoxylate aminotransferase family protein [Gemmataceae bacterium]